MWKVTITNNKTMRAISWNHCVSSILKQEDSTCQGRTLLPLSGYHKLCAPLGKYIGHHNPIVTSNYEIRNVI